MSLVKKSCNIGGILCEIWIVEVEKDKFMYGGHGVAKCLGYKNTRDAIQKHVKPQWKITWERVAKHYACVTSPDEAQLPANWHPHTVFISEAGVYALIMRSKLPAAEEFQRWLFEEVLPELRKTGRYELQQPQQPADIDWANRYMEIVRSDHRNQLAALRAEHRSELMDYELKLRDVEKCYERQIMEYKQREHELMLRELKYKSALNEFRTTASLTLTEFGVNALLARDNIAENEQLRDNIQKIKHRVIPQMDQQPDKEHYTCAFAYEVNGRKRVRVTRNQYNQVEKMDKIIQQFKDPKLALCKNTKTMEQYKWLDGAEKFLQIKCPNAISLWNKTKELFPHACFGFNFVTSIDVEFLDADEIRQKYRDQVVMCQSNRKTDREKIESFVALKLTDEEDAVRKCYTPSVDGKKRVAQLIEDTHRAVEKEIVPQEEGKRYENVAKNYTPEDIVSRVKNYNKRCVNNMFIFSAPLYITNGEAKQ